MDDLGGTPIFGNIHVDMDLLENQRGSIWSFWPLDSSNPWTQPFLPSSPVVNRGARAYLRTTQSWNAGVFSLLCSVVLTSLDFDNEFISSTETNELSYCQPTRFCPWPLGNADPIPSSSPKWKLKTSFFRTSYKSWIFCGEKKRLILAQAKYVACLFWKK